MVKFLGSKKIKIAVFISGSGSNLKSLINFCLKNKNKIKIQLIISDNSEAKGLIFAKIHKIEKKIYKFNKKKNWREKNSLFFKKKEYQTNLSCGIYENFIT